MTSSIVLYYETLYSSKKKSTYHIIHCIIGNIVYTTNLTSKLTSTTFNDVWYMPKDSKELTLEQYEQLLIKYNCI